MQTLRNNRTGLEELRVGMNSYHEQRRVVLLREAIDALAIKAEGLAGLLRREQDSFDNRSARLRDLHHQRREAGGDAVEHWENEKRGLEEQRSDRMRRRQQAVDACNALGWSLPANPDGFAELLGSARREIEAYASGSSDAMFDLARRRDEAQKTRDGITREIASLRLSNHRIFRHI
ncbi:hypothetical protein LP420_22230 [Massilia sp. B-10]|nr:hypothetical protein LP420_22230 [Massilia sp. B-10]